MPLGAGTVYDGELTIWDLGSRTSTGFFPTNDAVGRDIVYQVTVSGLTGGGKQAVFDFDASLDGTNWGHVTAAVKKTGDASTIDADGTYMYYVQDQPSRYTRVHLLTLTSSSTTTVSVKMGSM